LRLLFSSVQARYHYTQTNYDCQESHDSNQYPSEHTGITLVAEIKNKLPKPHHLSLGHAL
ncbi:MAG TPA: hypothetical protein VF205_03400, partial [Nitrospiraceae bacterium]